MYSEAANLRHLPEALWFLYWCLRNSHEKQMQITVPPPTDPRSAAYIGAHLPSGRQHACSAAAILVLGRTFLPALLARSPHPGAEQEPELSNNLVKLRGRPAQFNACCRTCVTSCNCCLLLQPAPPS